MSDPNLSSFIWSVADLLRGDYKQSEYGKVILPLENKPGSELFQAALNSPLQEPLKIYPVSNLVNSPKTDDPRCIEPAQIDRDMFEKPWWGD